MIRARAVALVAAVLLTPGPAVLGYVHENFRGQPLHRGSQISFVVDSKVAAALRNADGAVTITPESDAVGAIAAAMDAWNAVPTASVNIQLTVSRTGPPGRDFVNSISFDDTPATRSLVGSAIAVTSMTYDSDSVIVDSDIVFNPTLRFATTPTPGCFDIQSIATHELGHALGAGHAALASATMFAYSAEEQTWPRHLSSDDIAFVSDAFPRNAPAQGGVFGTLAFSSGKAVSNALVLVINAAGSFIVGAYSTGAAYSTGGLPPGDYFVVAVPAPAYMTGSEPQDWQSTFHGGGTPQPVSVSGGQLARADISIPDGPAKLRFDFGSFGVDSGGFAALIPSGLPLYVQLIGKGFAATIRPDDIVIYGPGISVRPDSLRVLRPTDPTQPGMLAFTADVAPRTGWADVVIAVHDAELAAVYSGARLMPAGPQVTPSGVVNAASFVAGAVAPGEIVSLFGSGIGPETPLTGAFDEAGKLVTTLGETAVEFDGQPAPLFYVSSGQVNAQVPFEVAARPSTRVRIQYKDAGTEMILPVAAASPEIFGEIARPAIVNQDGSMNDSSHPAARGSIIVAYGTGQGMITPPLATGVAALADPLSRSRPLTASIGNVPARVDFAGMAPGFVGLMQLNVAIPDGSPAGAVPLKLSVSGIASSGQTYVSVE